MTEMTVILTPEQVLAKYGPLHCKGFLTLVDEKNGVAQIVEKYTSRGTGEWDIANRKRAGGIIDDISMEGDSLVMNVIIGERPLNFGPVSADLGGQGVSALKVEGDEVRTTWHGLAGASVGIGARIPQCTDVLRTEYPDDFKIGGANYAHVDIITPKLSRVIIGIDDTDTKEEGASWVVAFRLGLTSPVGKFIEHKIIQLNPKVPSKTTNCCSTAVSFAVKDSEIPALIEYARNFIRDNSYSKGAVMTVYVGLKVPEAASKFGWDAKSIMFKPEDAIKVAGECGIQIIHVTGSAGVIGAVAAIGCFDMGRKSAGVPEDFE